MWTEDIIQQVWEKGLVEEGFDKTKYRKDACGAWIMRDKYGNVNHNYGWEIDHIYPKALGGNDNFVNLRPLHIRNNKSKGDNYPDYKAAIESDGTKNVSVDKSLTVNEQLQLKLREIFK
jgi:hypothetical protein